MHAPPWCDLGWLVVLLSGVSACTDACVGASQAAAVANLMAVGTLCDWHGTAGSHYLAAHKCRAY